MKVSAQVLLSSDPSFDPTEHPQVLLPPDGDVYRVAHTGGELAAAYVYPLNPMCQTAQPLALSHAGTTSQVGTSKEAPVVASGVLRCLLCTWFSSRRSHVVYHQNLPEVRVRRLVEVGGGDGAVWLAHEGRSISSIYDMVWGFGVRVPNPHLEYILNQIPRWLCAGARSRAALARRSRWRRQASGGRRKGAR